MDKPKPMDERQKIRFEEYSRECERADKYLENGKRGEYDRIRKQALSKYRRYLGGEIK